MTTRLSRLTSLPALALLLGCNFGSSTPVTRDAGVITFDGAALDAPAGPSDATVDAPSVDAVTEAGGCLTAADCPIDEACDTTSRACTTACNSGQPCNEGCCSAASAGTCQVGTDPADCGANGGLCAGCAAGFAGGTSGSACEPVGGGGQCGCGASSDCPGGSAGCNLGTGLCTFTCALPGTPCVAGCCGTAGSCVPGTGSTSCGASGACLDCTGNAAGSACVTQTQTCGCNTAADCPAGEACDTTTHLCGTACGGAASTACNGGCCDPLSGQCAPGSANGSCGSGGGTCSACSGGTPTCAGGVCTSACGAAGDGTCSGGNCCSGTTCVAGTAPGACGPSGTCTSCAGNAAGGSCIAGARCGCAVAGDCPSQEACNLSTGTCGAGCGDADYSACNGGCCNEASCVTGTSNGACGNAGGACTGCAGATPTCLAQVCAAACGQAGDGACTAGTCCASSGSCQPETLPTACGAECVDCTGNAAGAACVGGVCGCNVATDCPLYQSCDTTTHACTTVCEAGGCNGGCCPPATVAVAECSTGTADGACGFTGGGCVNCLRLEETCNTSTGMCQ